MLRSLLQDIECSSPCHTVGPYCLSILYIAVGIDLTLLKSLFSFSLIWLAFELTVLTLSQIRTGIPFWEAPVCHGFATRRGILGGIVHTSQAPAGGSVRGQSPGRHSENLCIFLVSHHAYTVNSSDKRCAEIFPHQ